MKYAAGVTLYYPTDEQIRSIVQYSKYFSYVFIKDNSPSKSQYADILKNVKNIEYFFDGVNWGLPKVFNNIMELCINLDVDYLCTLDQDSILSSNLIEIMQDYINTSKIDNVGIYAPNPVPNLHEKKTSKISEVNWVICSGSFINIKGLNKYQIKYDENYFIDRFDADFCMQIKLKGMKIIKLKEIEMLHMCGDGERHTHNIYRHYYMFRNRFYFNHKYYSNIEATVRTCLQNIRHLFNIFLKEDAKISKAKMYELAKADYIKKKFGKMSDDTFLKIEKIMKKETNYEDPKKIRKS